MEIESGLTSRSLDFLKQFFSAQNQCRWEDISNAEIETQNLDYIRLWISDLKRNESPLVFPRFYDGGSIDWYVIAFSQREFRALREHLFAFVGPTYTNFIGQADRLDLSDLIESAVFKFAGKNVYKFSLAVQDKADHVWQSLVRMRAIVKKKPVRESIIPRATGRILRDFEIALQAGNRDSAGTYIEELRREGRLSAQNIAFLKVQYFAAMDLWHELLSLPEMTTLLDLRRPVSVSESIIKAIYITKLLKYEIENSPEGALSFFRSDILPRYSALFRVLASMRSPEALKSFMIYAAVADPPRPDFRDQILDDYIISGDSRRYLEKLSDFVHGTPAKGLIDVARKYINSGNFDSAFKCLIKCDPDKDAVMMLLVCVSEISTLEVARVTIQKIESCSKDIKESILSIRIYRKIWDEIILLCGSGEKNIPNNWIEWLELLNSYDTWPAAVKIAAQGSYEWMLNEFKNNEEHIKKFSNLLMHNRTAEANAALKNAMPYLIRFFLPNEVPDRLFKQIYNDLILLLALDEEIGADDLGILNDLVKALLEVGLSDKEYVELLEEIHDIWKRHSSPRHLAWALDMLDILASFPCPNSSFRSDFFSFIIASVNKWKRRVTADQWDFLSLLCEDYDQANIIDALRPLQEADGVPYTTTAGFYNFLEGRTVAVYTLTDSVGRRIKSILEKKFKGVKVEISNDHVGNDRLRTMARMADIFLVATKSAKHAATEFIMSHRSKKNITLYPNGKGSSAMLNALYEYLNGVRN